MVMKTLVKNTEEQYLVPETSVILIKMNGILMDSHGSGEDPGEGDM